MTQKVLNALNKIASKAEEANKRLVDAMRKRQLSGVAFRTTIKDKKGVHWDFDLNDKNRDEYVKKLKGLKPEDWQELNRLATEHSNAVDEEQKKKAR